ncbi:hypothetical protein C8J57DRAFT_1353557 [Mycena rebaudengoi]|nr:hypothetical protein C8J57DRAFT_1353557 [Mycena rebaudengoi]
MQSSASSCEACKSSTEPRFLPDPTQFADLHKILRFESLRVPSHTAHFRRLADSAPAEIARYEAEIKRLRGLLKTLEDDRATVTTFAEGCRSILAPVRRLPAEVLVEIFSLIPEHDGISRRTTPVQELDRLAKKELLVLSKVSFYWHSVVMGTPRLWSTLVADMDSWEEPGASPHTLLALLARSLQRGATHPLTMELQCRTPWKNQQQALELVGQHSHRWRDMYFSMNEKCFSFLSGARANMPNLEVLEIMVEGGWTEQFDVFAVAPRLTNVEYAGPTAFIPTFPWGQLQQFGFVQMSQQSIWDSLCVARRCSGITRLRMNLDLRNALGSSRGLPSIESPVSFLSLLLSPGTLGREHSKQALGNIMGCLTLGHAREIHFRPWFPSAPLFWNQPEFLAFASRSSFRDNLTSLYLDHVIATDDEVLQSLLVLPLLEKLELSDYGASQTYNIPEHVLITEKLLIALTSTNDADCLVPRLTDITLISLIRFTDSTYLNFLTSRLILHRPSSGPFNSRLWWIPGHERTLSQECEAQLLELIGRWELIFSFGEAPFYEEE